MNKAGHNRFRDTWLGRVIIPVPTDYLKGLDRAMHERETPGDPPGEAQRPVEVTDHSLAAAGRKIPLGVCAMMVWSLIAIARRRPSGTCWADQLSPWVPVVTVLPLTTPALGPFSQSVGILLTIPFAIIIASGPVSFPRPHSRMSGWIAAACRFGQSGIAW